MVEQAFTGFVALPAPEQPWQVLGLDTSTPTPDQVEAAYRRLASEHHPDRGGDTHQMARINAARDALCPPSS
jgi:curved DNA-binding protein CbpA